MPPFLAMPPRGTRTRIGPGSDSGAATLINNAGAPLEPLCAFCGTPRGQDAIGELLTTSGLQGLHAHRFCLLFTSSLPRRGLANNRPLLGLNPAQVLAALQMAVSSVCKFCHRTGATIRCCLLGCTGNFHGPCGIANGCLFQYFGEYRTYCPNHRPLQHIVPLDVEGDACPMCLEPLERPPSQRVLVTPCCRRLMHRHCIQQQANSAGIRCFRCPYCNNQEEFMMEMADHGIYIPVQDASWEREPRAFEELLFEYQHCDAPTCRCPMGRDHAGSDDSPWEVVVCSSCAARGMHAACGLLDPSSNWVCGECAQVIGEGSDSSYADASQSSSEEEDDDEEVIVIDDDEEFDAGQMLRSAAAAQREPRNDTTRDSASGGRQEPNAGASANVPVRFVCESVNDGTVIVRAVPRSPETRNGGTRDGRPVPSRRNEPQNRRQAEERASSIRQHVRRDSPGETEPRARQQLDAPRHDRSGAGHSSCTEAACGICRPGAMQAASAYSSGSSGNDTCELCALVTGQQRECLVPDLNNRRAGPIQLPRPENNVIVIQDPGSGAQPAAGGHPVNAAAVGGGVADVRPRNVITRIPPTHYVVPQGLYYMSTQNVGLQLQCVPVIGATVVYTSAMMYAISSDRA